MANIDKVTLNGTDYKLIDSTVPNWAKQLTKPSYAANEISGLATVATSGSYNDLSDKPNIPTSADINAVKPLIVNITRNVSGSNITYSADTTVADINSAVKAGRTVIAKINNNYYQLHYCNEVSVNEIEGEFFAATATSTPDITYTLSFYSYRETTSDPWEDGWEYNILEEATPDWNITNQYTRGYIKNKPTIPTVGTLNTNNSTAQTPSSSESFSGNISLHKVSKTGSYNDLLSKPNLLDATYSNGTVYFVNSSTPTSAPSNYYTRSEIDTKIGNIETLLASI